MIIAKLIDWQPIASLPEDRKDGRIMLLWADDQAVTARWNAEIVEYGVPRPTRGAWDTGFFSGPTDDPETVTSPTYWADINPPA